MEALLAVEETGNDLWKELKELYWAQYVQNSVDKVQFERYVRKVKSADDYWLVRALLAFSDSRKACTFNSRFEWLTMQAHGRQYPPLASKDAGKLIWNARREFRYAEPQQAAYKQLARPRGDAVADIQQHPDLGNCSMVCALINVKRTCGTADMVADCGDVAQVNLFFNGARRLVTLHRAEVRQNMRREQLAVLSPDMHDKLIEQAYFEVAHGMNYESMGSNTAMDTYMLCGWFPLVVETSEVDFPFVQRYLARGAMLALGTHATRTIDSFCLRKNHDYAVLDVCGTVFRIRDPLVAGNVIELAWEDVRTAFHLLYINWDAHTQCQLYEKFHFRYNSAVHNRFMSWLNKPTYRVVNDTESELPVYALFERHLSNRKYDNSIVGVISGENLVSDTEEGNNIGMQWVELTVPPHSSRILFYHSNTNTNCTLHLFSNSPRLKVAKWSSAESSRLAVLDGCWQPISKNLTFTHWPAFKFEIKHPETDGVHVSLQFCWANEHSAALFIYHASDYRYEKPLLHRPGPLPFPQAFFELALDTNTPYVVLCQSMDVGADAAFQLAIQTEKQGSVISTVPTSRAYGGLRFHTSKLVSTAAKRIELPFKVSRSTDLHITLYSKSSPLVLKCAVFSDGSDEAITATPGFVPINDYPYVLPITFAKERSLVLLIELQDTVPDSTVTIEIGSNCAFNFCGHDVDLARV
ncbi:ADR274Cp [Eremothecium gossypii ATCC 10895]|uniref:Calpain-like protease palB/RIM13 n=1 Tax=Eremothecium gossypii (strain ATCC 10895 / CBS 109.51 / FGSC 9923 / NRRL Y-1056) TaxID=284811 RepID=PALB_EREGS|nr:ADR274Cp [Eremothecium gossypii ATCC 10895]Q759K3.2 RecName: Full=Calpain-like protease palB/RIM13; AltName: Full=Cysteine protease RIM13 [Eremothecium gossypii ATCC 10895]AAS52194.2 ADR274Cp [Eremothecium gossypii ATCC 10895]AEY96493.1 FADR274Cp [Eremothecium gossypii FDAG1]